MSTSKSSAKPTHSKSHAAPATVDAAAPTGATGTSPAPAAVTSDSLVSFPQPPALSQFPSPPSGYLAATTPQFRGVIPFQAEQASLRAAIKDLGRIPNYALFVGAPPQALFIALLTLAGEWTDVRNASFVWDQYACTQEGTSWTKARPLMDEFRNAFIQAQKADPTLAALLPGLTTFLGVRSAAAQKGASTKRANRKAEAAGLRPEHGQVGKRRKRAAANAALAEADANGTSAPGVSLAAGAPTAPTPGPTGGAQVNGTPKA